MATRNKKRRNLSVASNDGTSPKKTKTAMMTSLECPGKNFLQNLFKKISKGQFISKALFDVIVSTKKQTKIFLSFYATSKIGQIKKRIQIITYITR